MVLSVLISGLFIFPYSDLTAFLPFLGFVLPNEHSVLQCFDWLSCSLLLLLSCNYFSFCVSLEPFGFHSSGSRAQNCCSFPLHSCSCPLSLLQLFSLLPALPLSCGLSPSSVPYPDPYLPIPQASTHSVHQFYSPFPSPITPQKPQR